MEIMDWRRLAQRLWKTARNADKTVVQKSGPDNLINDCKWCGKTVVALAQQPKKFCGPLCYQRWKRGRKPKLPPVKCVECGTEFVPIRDNHSRCSLHCRKINQLRYQARLRKQEKVIERKACKHCGQLFKPEKYTVKYCSSACKQSAEYRPPRKKFEYSKRDIIESDLNTSAFADEIAKFKAKGGKIQVAPGLPDPKVANINLGVKKGKDGAEWDAKDLADLDQYEDVINLTNNF